MVELQNINFRFEDNLIFENFSAKIELGQKVAIVGESGSGKSTFLNFLAGFEIPSKGKIIFDSVELTSETAKLIRQKIAWFPQNFNVPFESINELFFSPFTLKINKKNKPSTSDIAHLFNKLGIEPNLLNKKIDEVSGGQKQRIILASVILSKKKYIILDEPTSALDDLSTQKLLDVLWEYQETTIIVATHDKKIIEKADLIIDLNI